MNRHGAYSERNLLPRTEAVSPVVGSILILMIMVMGIAGVMAWGVPAIQGLQGHTEFQSVQTQMLEVNQEVRSLRDPKNTLSATLSIASGRISVEDGDRWVITAMTDPTYTSFKVGSYENDDDTLTFPWVPATAVIQLYNITGSQDENTPQVQPVDSCTGCGSLSISPANIETDRFMVLVTDGGVQKVKAWIFNVGRIQYHQGDRAAANFNHLEMGASIIQQDRFLYMRQSPTIKEPDFDSTPADRDFFVRAVHKVGSGEDSQSGRGEYNVLVHLVDNYGRTDFNDANLVRFQVNGTLEEAFCNFFLSRQDYAYDGATTGCSGDALGSDVDVLYNPGQDFAFGLIESEVSVRVRAL